jgi:hypothetical protein
MTVVIEDLHGGRALEAGGTGDLAERWGVTTQRVRQLADEPGFPEQLGTVNGNPVWDIAACDRWRAQNRRRAGRPRLSAEQIDALADSVLAETFDGQHFNADD